jgi:hypothetical protein
MPKPEFAGMCICRLVCSTIGALASFMPASISMKAVKRPESVQPA